MQHRLRQHWLRLCLRALVLWCAVGFAGLGVSQVLAQVAGIAAVAQPARGHAVAAAPESLAGKVPASTVIPAAGKSVAAAGGVLSVDSGTPVLPSDHGGAVLPQRVRVGTWNVRNYMAMDRHYDGRYRRDYPKPEAEKTALRQILLDVRPDILLLQEIGGAAYLRELQADLKREGLDYPYAIVPEETPGLEDTYGDRQVAVLSRYPWARTEQAELTLTYFGKRQPLLRALLEVQFETAQGTRWSVFTLHLKSRYTNRKDDPESLTLRTAEATAIRNYLARKYPPDSGAHYIIAGDFNDLQNSAPLRRFLTRGDVTLNYAVECVDGRGEIWTYYYAVAGSYQRVDYILASPAMRWRVSDGSIADHLPQSRIASDHRLLYADIDLTF